MPGNTTTVVRYLNLLADAGLITGLQKYSVKPYLSKRSTPKLYVLNTAVMTAGYAYPFGRVRDDGAFWGRLCDSAVDARLHNTLPPDRIVHLRYWRDGAGEVDFVRASGRELLAADVKSGHRRGRIAGLESFGDRFPGAKRLVVGTGEVPFNEFLSDPVDYWLEEAHRAR